MAQPGTQAVRGTGGERAQRPDDTPAGGPGGRPPGRAGRADPDHRRPGTSLAAARATTPFGPSNAQSDISSPCTTAATSRAGAVLPPVTRLNRPDSRDATVGEVIGRPSASGGTTSRAASTCTRARTCLGTFGHRLDMLSSSRPTRSAPCTTGSITAPARTSSSGYPCRSSAALATAERSAISAATAPPERRSAGWLRAASTSVRAASRAARTSARSRSGASGSVTVTQSSRFPGPPVNESAMRTPPDP